jgi:hypothetical protein
MSGQVIWLGAGGDLDDARLNDANTHPGMKPGCGNGVGQGSKMRSQVTEPL